MTVHLRPEPCRLNRIAYCDDHGHKWLAKTTACNREPSAWRSWPLLDCGDRDYSWYERTRDGYRICTRCAIVGYAHFDDKAACIA